MAALMTPANMAIAMMLNTNSGSPQSISMFPYLCPRLLGRFVGHGGQLALLAVAQALDLVAEAVAAVGDDPLDVDQPVLQRTELGPKLRVFLSQQLDSLLRLRIRARLQRLAPHPFDRVAVLDLEPGIVDAREDP